MQKMYAERQEATRVQMVQSLVSSLYEAAIHTAQTTTQTFFYYPIPGHAGIVENMADILAQLKPLFPGCKVSHSLLSRGTDGKLYDIENIQDKDLPLLTAVDKSYIVIEWS